MNPTSPERLEMIARILSSGAAVGVFSFLIYMNTLAPGVYGFDSAELATGAYTLGIVHPPGFPLYLLIGKLFTWLPFGDVAYRLNVMSAVFAALTVTDLYSFLLGLTGRRSAAWVGAALAGFSYTFWQMAVIAEVYTLHTFLLVMALLFLQRWQQHGQRRHLLLFALVYGLSLTNHTSGLMFAPAFAWLVVRTPHWHWREVRTLLHMGGVFMASLLLYAYLPLRAAANPPLNYAAFYNVDLTSLDGIYWMISAQAYRFFAFGYPLAEIPAEAGRFFHDLWRNFMGVGVLLAVPGAVWLWRRQRTLLVGLSWIFAVNAVFYINYRVLDKDTMFLPAYLMWVVFAAAGMAAAAEWIRRWIDAGYLFPEFAQIYGGLLVFMVIITAVLNWRWVDMSEMNGPALFGQQVENQRPDVTIYNRSRSSVARFYRYWKNGESAEEILPRLDEEEIQYVQAEITRRPVFIVEYDPLFEREFEFVPQLNVFRLLPRLPHRPQ